MYLRVTVEEKRRTITNYTFGIRPKTVHICPPSNLSSRIGWNESGKLGREEQEKVKEKIEVVEVRTKVVSHYITVSRSRSYPETRYSITG